MISKGKMLTVKLLLHYGVLLIFNQTIGLLIVN